jgi:hypothetical protein
VIEIMRSISPAQYPRERARDEWLLLALLWIPLGLLLWTAACAAPLSAWNPPRLAAAYALAAGQNLYPDPTTGAQIGWFYGPGSAIWLLPVTAIGSPSWAITTAVIYNAAALLAAIAWVLSAADLTGHRLAAATGLTGVLLFASGVTPQYWLLNVHVDAPCLTFSLLTIGAVCRFDFTQRAVWLHFAALGAVAACLTKQSAALLPLAISGCWLARRNARTAVRYLAWFGLYGVASVGLLALYFDLGNAFFYVVRAHAVNPWKPGTTFWRNVFRPVLCDTAPWIALFALVCVANWRSKLPRQLPERATIVTHWLSCLGAILLPVGFFAALKAGGGLNTAHGLMFLFLAVVVHVAQAPIGRRLRLLGSVVFATLAFVNAGERLRYWRPSPYQDLLLKVAEKHRGEIYFPWNPLITLLTDRRIYPFEDALYCLTLVRTDPPSSAAIRSALPSRPLVVYDPIAPTREVARYSPGLQAIPIYTLAAEMTAYRP